jgi:hypothetical protein
LSAGRSSTGGGTKKMSGGSVAVKNGAAFERKYDVIEHIKENANVKIVKDVRKIKRKEHDCGYIIYNNGKKFRCGMQREFTEILALDYNKPSGGIAYLNALGEKKKIPDSFIMDEENKKLIILELKYQTTPGTVESKIKGLIADIVAYMDLMGEDWEITFYLIGNWWFSRVKHLITYHNLYNLRSFPYLILQRYTVFLHFEQICHLQDMEYFLLNEF